MIVVAQPGKESENKVGIVRFQLAPEQSRVTVQAFAEGLFSAFGHNPVFLVREFSGYAQLNPETFSDAALKMTVRAGSLVVKEDVKEKDRIEIERMMREEVLEIAKYPDIVFESTNISLSRINKGRYRARIIGDLTLHGVTQSNLWSYAEVSFNDERLRAQGEFSLKQSDFQIKRVSVAGGTLKVKNEVKLTFDIVGLRREG